MDGVSLAEYPLPLLLPFAFILSFAVIWLLVTTMLALTSGWFRLTKAHPDRPQEAILRLTGRSGLMGPGINMQGVLRLSVCPSGLRLGISPLLGPFSKDFLVPWGDISVSRRRALFWQIARLQFGTPRIGVLTLRASIADTLAAAAGKRLPEIIPPPETSP